MQESTKTHSYYHRYPQDLAWAQYPVVLHIQAKRFFCLNEACSKRTFVERVPEYLEWYTRKTKRVLEKQQRIGISMCARTAETLLALEQIKISDTTINRLVRALPDPASHEIEVLGVDDWAKRKGQRYGTILIDQQNGVAVDVLEDRTAETLESWLRTHPEIKIVTRDRSKTYAEAIRNGAPQAVQVADRWHLLKNASEVVYKIFQQDQKRIVKCLNQGLENKKAAGNYETETPVCERELTNAELRRKQRIDQVQALVNKGWTRKAAVHHLNIHPKTVRRYLDCPSAEIPRLRRHGKLDPFKAFLLKRWNEGCHNGAQLFREIQPQGYSGKVTLVMDYAHQLRQASGLPPKVRKHDGNVISEEYFRELPSARTLAWWVFRSVDKRQEKDEQILVYLAEGEAKLHTTISLARDFAEMIRKRQPDRLDSWVKCAKESGVRIWGYFAEALEQDIAAVRAALTYSWSNGRTEGNVNRLKTLKRMMYGRA